MTEEKKIVISDKESEDNKNFHSKIPKETFAIFQDENNNIYSIRFGTANDAEAVSSVYEDVYGKDYIYPVVYDIDRLRKNIEDKDNYWFVGECIYPKKEIFGSGVMEKKNPYIVFLSKMAIIKKFRNRGLARVLGSQGIFNALRFEFFKDIRRLDSDVRCTQINAQKFAEKIRSNSFSFIPSFYAYGDRTRLDLNQDTPFSGGKNEPAFLYSSFIRDFWKLRDKEVFLLKNKNIQYFYNYLKNKIYYMKRDKVIIKTKYRESPDDFQVEKDNYKGIVTLKGNIRQETLQNLIDKYQKWRLILWEVPATSEGLLSQKLALRNSFFPVGYNPGSIVIQKNGKDHLRDSIYFLMLNEKVDFNQYREMNLTEINLDLAKKVIESIPKNKRKFDMVFSSLYSK